MQERLKILSVDDSEDDVLLLAREFKKSRLDTEFTRVDTREALRSALKEGNWDIVLCDYAMPHFNGMAALQTIRATAPDLPVIFISGTIGEEVAVEAMRAGANDYLMKDNLKRLVPAVERELRETGVRSARRRAEEALRQREAELNESQRLAHIGSWDWDAASDTIWWSEEYYRIYGFDPKQAAPNYAEHLRAYTRESAQRLDVVVKRAMETGDPYEVDLELAHPTPATQWIVARGEAKRDASGRIWGLRGTAQNITERKRAEESLRRAKEEWELTFDAVPDLIALIDTNHRIIRANRAMAKRLKCTPELTMGCHCYEAVHGLSAPPDTCPHSRLLNSGQEEYSEVVEERLSGVFDVSVTPLHDPAGNLTGSVHVARDITERKHAEDALRRLNRELLAISNCNQVLVRAEDEQTLLGDICRIICDEAGYRMAWVGYAENDAAKTIRPVAWAGTEDGYLEEAKLTWSDTERGRSPSGTAVRTGESVCIQDFASDPQAASWRDSALQRGYRASIALPLKDESAHTFGVLNIYSPESHAFIPDEIRLLEELTGDLAFGIMVLRARIERKRADEEHLAHLRFVESLDKVNRAIQGTDDLEQMMRDVLDAVLSIFDCDRTWLVYPCDPDALLFRVPMEINKPEYPGAKVLNVDVPMSSDAAQNMREALESASPVTYTAGSERPINKVTAERFGVKSQMIIALYPKGDTPWIFGLHQCSYARNWTPDEEKLLQEISRRLADALTSLLAYANLQESEARLAEAQRIAKFGNWEWDIPNNRLWWSDEAFRIFGTRPEEFGATLEIFINAVHPDDRERVQTAIRHALEGDSGIWQIDYRITRADGTIRFVHEEAETIFGQDGRPLKKLGTVQDITERKRAENALRDSEEEKTVLNEIAKVFLTIPDEEMYGGVLTIVRRVMASRFGIFGYIGENGDLVIPSLTRDIWDQCQVPGKSIVFSSDSWGDSLWGKAIRQKTAFCSDGPFETPPGHILVEHFLTVPIVFGLETIGLLSVANKEGGYAERDLDLLKRIAEYIQPILNARLQRDRQERRRIQAEAALRESEQKYRLLVANAGEAIFIAQDGVVKFPNAKALELTGYSAEELAGIPFAELIHPEERASIVERHMRRLGEKGPAETPRFRIVDKQGGQIWTQLTAARITWEERPGILCFLRDITEEKKLESQFLQAQKMEAVGQLAGGVAHDFNNLLQVILGYVDILLEDLGKDTENGEALGVVQEAAERAADLTRQLLAFSRRQIIQPVNLDVNDLMQGVLKMIRRVIGENIALRFMPGERLGMVHADTGQLEQVVMNLCVNARDAMPTGGILTIETENVAVDAAYSLEHPWAAEGHYVLLSVTDTGHGMDEATRAQIFEPFFTTKEVGQGTGLGLATVYGIVKQHNGLIHVYSKPGKGTAFKVYLPVAEQVVEVVESKAEERAGGGTETILVAEDEETVRQLIRRMLETAGYTVLTACDGEDALRVAEEHAGAINLALLDVMMPKLGGGAVMDRIHARFPAMRFLFSSGYSESAIHTNFVMKEGLRLITKPYRRTTLLHAIREILDAP